MGRKRSLLALSLAPLFSLLIKLRDFLNEVFNPGELLAAIALEADIRKQAIWPLIFGLAVGEAREPAESSPVRCTGISVVARCQRLGYECSQELRQGSRMFEPSLEVAGAGLYNRTRGEAVRPESCERSLIKIVENCVAMFA